MGTRSLTVVYDEENSPICTMYRHMDGYPSCHGKELVEYLNNVVLTSGVTNIKYSANGMNCLAAMLFKVFKEEPGGIYLFHPDTQNIGEEFVYEVYFVQKPYTKNTELKLVVKRATSYDGYQTEQIFSGTMKEFLDTYKKLEEDA